MKKRILFVDDESKILFGLRRTFRSMRNAWEMSFAKSGTEALEIMSRDTFDIVVTDMHMPGMSGIELLKEVSRLYPKTARFAFSGFIDKETILRSENFIHQYISKPCDAETLKNVLTRTCMLHDLLLNDKLEDLISKIQSLPSLPSLYNEILKKIESPKVSLHEIGEIISQDISLSSKVLQVANIVQYGAHHNITNPVQATIQLGLETVKNLVLLNHVLLQFDMSKLRDLSINELWNHSVEVGACAKNIIRAENIGPEIEDSAFAAGLLHDLGKLVLATNLSQEYSSALTIAKNEGITISEAEYKVFDTTHSKVGAYLLGLWGLPDIIIDSVIFHHNPLEYMNKNFNVLTAVHVADYFEHEPYPEKKIGIVYKIDSNYLDELGLTQRLSLWRELRCKEIFMEGNNNNDRENSARR